VSPRLPCCLWAVARLNLAEYRATDSLRSLFGVYFRAIAGKRFFGGTPPAGSWGMESIVLECAPSPPCSQLSLPRPS